MKHLSGDSSDAPTALLEESICSSAHSPLVALLRAAHDVEARLDQAFVDCGLTAATYGVLRVLARKSEPVVLTELASALACVRSNVTQLVDRLESDGLVKRVEDAQDRRSRRATLTALGRKRLAAGTAAYGSIEGAVFGALSVNDRERLVRFLESIA